jgi:hypothetical protein
MQRIKYFSRRHKTPLSVQKLLRSLPYNNESTKETLRSAEAALKNRTAHCFEAALIAAAILEQHCYPPLLLSLDSVDDLDHVLFVYKKNGLWGSVARSRDQGLHGRLPIYKSLRALAWSYFDPYVDKTGRLRGYRLFDLNQSGLDWRQSTKNLWSLDDFRLSGEHTKMRSSNKRYMQLRRRYFKNGAMEKLPAWL